MKYVNQIYRLPVFLAAVLAFVSQSAFAHHAMGGATPATFAQGFVSGLAHPVLGIDHLAFVIGIGLLAAACGRRYTLPLAFVVMTAAGALAFVSGATLPFAEAVIALSVAAVGVLLISGRSLPAAYFGALFAVAGIFHGYAYGGSIVGAETTPLLAYLAGFALIQYAISVGASYLLDAARKTATNPAVSYERLAGGVIAGVALVFMVENVETLLFGVV